MKKCIALFLCIFPLSLWAGDAATLHFLGFSKDGKYLAFEQYGVTDGNGAAYSSIYPVDVAKNDYVAKPFVQEGQPDATDPAALSQLRADNLAKAKAKLKELSITEDNQGTHVISHPLSDLGVDPHKVTFALGTPLAGMLYESFSLTLEEQAGKAECFGFGEAKQFKLTIQPTPLPTTITEMKPLESLAEAPTISTTPETTTSDKPVIENNETTVTTLQADQKIPDTRGCPLAYRIQDVYIYNGEYIAVFLNIFSPGFEGQNMRYIVVTGKFRDVQG
ncbi:DUF2259 domain-containing protein [Beggiatoa leptomitoformis]|uniref:DUF2259 domain-containing protein n=1 Tax=Beggiatoa leptomitoformis TaxID=288004 RepID=A0A2N9YAY6_9GAMM|nr:DUF2259 domain-containing protein [Beggiatoa leptomitoformis]AUI67625.1 DUF2259 domain-containing protein [Beggiatoa leptomitoformis]QGX03525.1 DUF2259 domain-containing protein [Beggiatoa leptomitoformis]